MDVHASTPWTGQEDIPVCYERWNESEAATKALEKARKKSEPMTDKVKPAPRPVPEPETREPAEAEAV